MELFRLTSSICSLVEGFFGSDLILFATEILLLILVCFQFKINNPAQRDKFPYKQAAVSRSVFGTQLLHFRIVSKDLTLSPTMCLKHQQTKDPGLQVSQSNMR